MTDILKMADEICSFIRNRIPNKSGLFRTEQFNENGWSNDRCDPDDFGDFAPFMVWLDRITGNDINTNWVETQLELMNSLLRQKSGFYYPFSDGEKGARQSNFLPVYPQSHLDLVLGFNILYRLTKNKEYLQANKDLCNGVAKYALSRKGFVYGAVIPKLHLYFPRHGFLRYKPQVSGVFIEELANFYEISRSEPCLDAAKRIARAWSDTKSFKKYGLFPDQVYPITNKEVSTARVSKENTNMIYGLLRLYEISGEDWVRDMATRCMDGLDVFWSENTYQSVFDIKQGKIIDKEVSIIQNHMTMGVLLDANIVLKDKKYLTLAEECAGFWMAKEPDWDIDSHADLITMLSRIYNLTKKSKYKRSIRSLVENMKTFKSDGIFWKTKDGKTNELKFLGGALKGLLSAYTVLNNVKKIDKETLRLLMRDR